MWFTEGVWSQRKSCRDVLVCVLIPKHLVMCTVGAVMEMTNRLVLIKGKNGNNKNVLLHILLCDWSTRKHNHNQIWYLQGYCSSCIILLITLHWIFSLCNLHKLHRSPFLYLGSSYHLSSLHLPPCFLPFSWLSFEDADLPVWDCRSSKITLFYFNLPLSPSPLPWSSHSIL